MSPMLDKTAVDREQVIVDLQRDLAARTAERDEALAQQTATAEVLQVINSSPGDLAPVFDAMLDKAMHLCEAAFGILSTYDGDHFHAVALHGVSQEYAATYLGEPYRPGPGTTHDRLIQGDRLVHIPDLAADIGDDPGRRSVLERLGVRTILSVPLRKDGALLGIIHLYRQEVRPFSHSQVSLAESFADQAVIAMENARLITETREALDQQTATAEVLQVINSSPGDLGPVFEAMLDKAMILCGAVFGALMSYDGEKVSAVAARGLPPELIDVFREPVTPRRDGNSPYARFLRGEPLLHIVDMAADDVLPSLASRPRALVEIGGARTGLEIPLKKEDAVLGSIWLYRQEVRQFTDKQIALLQNFAAQAVIAIENARLLGELRQRTEEVAELNRDLEARVASQLAELERTGKLRRFLAPQLADLIVAQGDESILESHRREIVVVFCDLRGFTAFAERAEPEEVMALLGEYHTTLGPIVARFEGTLDHYAGDGIMVFFNDPVPAPEPAKRAIGMAVAMREAAQKLLHIWRGHGHDIGFGVGISQGYATLGQIGFAERMDYTAIGTVTNLAARLCTEAKDGQILISRRVATAVKDEASLEELGDLSLKGLSQAVAVYNVVQ
jgi:adenylate cyclase